MEIAEVVTSLADKTISGCVEDFLVLGDHDTLRNSEILRRVIVLKWLVIGIADNAHH